MNKHILAFFIFNFSFFISQSQEATKPSNTAFIRGEKLKFRAYYDSFVTGKVTAGIATLEVTPETRQVNGRDTYHVIAEGKSKGAFNLFFKVDDRFETYIDEEYLFPLHFIRKTREGGYSKDDEVRFNQFSNSASSSTANKHIPTGTQDIVSAFYFSRTIDFSKVKPGDRFPVKFFLDDSLYNSAVEFTGREDVEIEIGKFHCLRFRPMLVTGNVFSQPYAMSLWITDDLNHLPVLVKSEVVVGSVKLELIKYQGLANPVTSMTRSRE